MQVFPRKTDVKLVVVRWYPTRKTQYELFHEGVKPALGKTIRGKRNDNAWKHHLIDIGVFRQPQMKPWGNMDFHVAGQDWSPIGRDWELIISYTVMAWCILWVIVWVTFNFNLTVFYTSARGCLSLANFEAPIPWEETDPFSISMYAQEGRGKRGKGWRRVAQLQRHG